MMPGPRISGYVNEQAYVTHYTNEIQNVFTNGFPSDLVNTAFGRDVAGTTASSKMTPIGTGSNWGPEECLKQCGVDTTAKV